MILRRLELKSFRSYASAGTALSPGINIILGENAAGKTNLLEAAGYVLCGRSFRTSREAEMVREGGDYWRLEAGLELAGISISRAVAFGQGAGVKVESGGGPTWLAPGSVLCFSPDDLQLIKGAPAARRRFLDEAIGRARPGYQARTLDYQRVMSQRNSFLQRARAGLVPLADITPWDRQLAALAIGIHDARRDYCHRLEPLFALAYRQLSGEEREAGIFYDSQVPAHGESDERETDLLSALAEAWQKDMERASTAVGTHRDDADFQLEGRSLRPYGSQGEQRTAVLALLLASRSLELISGGTAPLLLLDDVMSELDRDRRRRFMRALKGAGGGEAGAGGEGASLGGQVIITAADPGLFDEEELEAAAVLKVGSGGVLAAEVSSSV